MKQENHREAIFAGGCFWCVEADFEKLKGVIKAISGYASSKKSSEKSKEEPIYEEVSTGDTNYVEAVKVIYDPKIISYEKLVDYFWTHHNPLDPEGQFADRGPQYKPMIFYSTQKEKEYIEKSKKELENSSDIFKCKIATQISPLGKFYPAEEYHQEYYKKNPIHYKLYRSGSGRDSFLKEINKEENHN